ncbi:hypothetical protein BMS3Abin14_00058 [bacterium BMS3Abin14]|nr:hypothetical protein BMS3Abin14_00058 [bacterium BMS3Abin14]
MDMDVKNNGNDTPNEQPHPRKVRVFIRSQHRESLFNTTDHSLCPGDEVLVQTRQGNALGVIRTPPAEMHCDGCGRHSILRKADPEEIRCDRENRALEKDAYRICRDIIADWEMAMRLVKTEYLLDRSKAIFFFTAEKRVDFRELVRVLAKRLQIRIEMRQIGIRDEAKVLGGVGPCGMAFCCSTFLREFAPISVKMAKEQNVILNPTKISGGCGRLLCCLHYEYEQYQEATSGLPKAGKKVKLPEGTGKVRTYNFFAGTVTIDIPGHGPLTMSVDDLREQLK